MKKRRHECQTLFRRWSDKLLGGPVTMATVRDLSGPSFSCPVQWGDGSTCPGGQVLSAACLHVLALLHVSYVYDCVSLVTPCPAFRVRKLLLSVFSGLIKFCGLTPGKMS